MTTLGVLAMACLGAALLARWAYRQGRRRGRRTLPGSVLDELARHKLDCLGEPPQRVALELSLLFGVEAPAARARAHAAEVPGQTVRPPGRAGGRS